MRVQERVVRKEARESRMGFTRTSHIPLSTQTHLKGVRLQGTAQGGRCQREELQGTEWKACESAEENAPPSSAAACGGMRGIHVGVRGEFTPHTRVRCVTGTWGRTRGTLDDRLILFFTILFV